MASSDDEEVSKLPDKCQSLRQRSIRKRIETERNKHLPKQRKQRERPAPLSKYREALTDFASCTPSYYPYRVEQECFKGCENVS